MKRSCLFLALLPILVLGGLPSSAPGKGEPVSPGKTKFSCFVGAGKVFVDRQLSGGAIFCTPLTEEPGWDVLVLNSLLIASYQTSSLHREGNTVDLLINMHIADPVQSEDGSYFYDGLRASYRFDCQARTQIMTGGVYSLEAGGKHDQAADISEPVRPGTTGSIILDRVCFGIDQHEADKAKYAADDNPEFVCPEYMPDEEGKKRELMKFFNWVAAKDAKATVADLVRVRYENLIIHACQKTLNYMATHNGPAAGPH